MRVGGEALEHYSGNGLLNALLPASLAGRVLDFREAMRHIVLNHAVLAMDNQLTWCRISSNGSGFLDGCLLSSEEIARFASVPFYGPPIIGAINMNCLGHLIPTFIIDEPPSPPGSFYRRVSRVPVPAILHTDIVFASHHLLPC